MKKTLRGKRYLRAQSSVEIGRNRRKDKRFKKAIKSDWIGVAYSCYVFESIKAR